MDIITFFSLIIGICGSSFTIFVAINQAVSKKLNHLELYSKELFSDSNKLGDNQLIEMSRKSFRKILLFMSLSRLLTIIPIATFTILTYGCAFYVVKQESAISQLSWFICRFIIAGTILVNLVCIFIVGVFALMIRTSFSQLIKLNKLASEVSFGGNIFVRK